MQVKPHCDEDPESLRPPDNTGTSQKAEKDDIAKWTKYLQAWRKPSLSSFEIFLFGIMIAIGAQSSGWNGAYSGGFWTAFCCVLVTGIGYLCLCLCLSEMVSALPFSGGIYGLVRATAGPFAGYLVPCFELLMNITYITAGFHSLKSLLGATHSPAFLILCYCSVLILCLMGGKVFWGFVNVFTITAVILLLSYCFGSLHDLDLHHYGGLSEPLTIYHFMTYLESCSTQYMGIQYLPLLCNLCEHPRTTLPRIIIAAPVICLFTALFLVITVAGHAPGIDQVSTALFPLSFQYIALFQISSSSANWFSFPGLFAALFGFLYCYGRQVQSISSMGLLPATIFQQLLPGVETPYVALGLGTALTILLGSIGVYFPIFLTKLYHVSTVSTNLVFFGACGSYLLFKLQFGQLQRSWALPLWLGLGSAGMGMSIFTLNIISALFFQGTATYTSLIVILGYLVLAIAFYVIYLGKHQTFSEEEKQQLFSAYLLNANKAKRERLRNRQQLVLKQQQQSSTTSHSGPPSGALRLKSNIIAPIQEESPPSQSSLRMERKEQQQKEEEGDPEEAAAISSSSSRRLLRFSFLHPLTAAVSGKSGRSIASRLSEDQELAIIRSGGLLEQQDDNENDNDEEKGERKD